MNFSILLITWEKTCIRVSTQHHRWFVYLWHVLFILLFNSVSLHDSLLISSSSLIKRLLSFPLILLYLFIYMFDLKLFVLQWIQITCAAAAANSQTKAVLQNPSGEENEKKKKTKFIFCPPLPKPPPNHLCKAHTLKAKRLKKWQYLATVCSYIWRSMLENVLSENID